MSSSPSASASAVLSARQARILDDIKRIESRLARVAQTVSRLHGAASAVPASNGKAAAEKPMAKAKGPKPPVAAAAASSSAATESSPATAALPSAALLASLNDDDPSRWWIEDASAAAAATGVIPRLTSLCADRSIDRFRFYRVTPTYYDLSLEQRRDILSLPSIVHLCKSVVMTNSRWEATDSSGRPHASNPQFVIVIVSYAEKLHKEKLARAMWEAHVTATAALGDASRVPLGKKSFNLRLAEESAAIALTGFEHNGMTPIGIKQNLPMLFASSLLRLEGGSLALGGGEVDVKWRVSIKQFLKAFQPIVADIVG